MGTVMTRLIAAVALFLALAISACGGGAPSSSPTTTATVTPDTYPPYTSVEDAVEHTVGKTDRDLLILAEPMTAQQAANRTEALGVGAFPLINSGGGTCPPYAHCPYPGEPPDSRGWLIIARDPAAANTGTVLVHLLWRSDVVDASTQASLSLSRLP